MCVGLFNRPDANIFVHPDPVSQRWMKKYNGTYFHTVMKPSIYISDHEKENQYEGHPVEEIFAEKANVIKYRGICIYVVCTYSMSKK